MQRDLVLSKFYETMEKLRTERIHSPSDPKRLDLRSKYKIPPSGCTLLRILLDNGSLNQRSIAKMMNISSQAVSETIKKLENSNLIFKENGTHNNEKIINLSDTGIEFAKELDEGIKKHAQTAFKNFSDTEIKDLYDLLDKITTK